ncbi:hypothetical protein D0Y65_009523 [Glycine soja]|uniref:Uncharacterized protein n=1 Tax=Glycine soja TaxID=3848 RepID=A0A445KZE2_GLYSO|nr:hypothetical protein D0Y65_009523 [Glycine soja]
MGYSEMVGTKVSLVFLETGYRGMTGTEVSLPLYVTHVIVAVMISNFKLIEVDG